VMASAPNSESSGSENFRGAGAAGAPEVLAAAGLAIGR